MNKPGTKMLCSQRCYLRKLEISDSQQLFENVYSDSKVAGYMSWNLYNNVTDVEKYLRKWQEHYKQNECYWGVFLKENNELIGTVYLYDENASAEVGFISYCFGSKFWGNGYATETIKVVLQYGFNDIGYNNITTFVAKSNICSQNVLSCLGFTCEATLRKRDKTDLGIEDCLSYSLLKEEIN
ncbi:MAG: GNAT family N-acetyltransferase [Eubacterium sp.]|nr:GNAT family N-acetyltransferase [Eubacterium sp.]